MQSFNWRCPFCGNHTTIVPSQQSFGSHRITLDTKLGPQVLKSKAIACPNQECKELFLTVGLADSKGVAPPYKDGQVHTRWSLRPEASVKAFPDYVPKPILDDHREACLIKNHSPKAAATLARRCLQGMIRDFWGITKNRLVDEIKELEGKVDAQTWESIDAVRHIGNIGAHMEKDINLIVDVDPNEANLLIELIETLIEEWYIVRHEKNARMKRIIAAADQKKAIKSGPGKGTRKP